MFQSQIARRQGCSRTRELTEEQQRVCVDKKKSSEKQGVIDSEKLEHSVKGYGQKTWDNVSQWSVCPSVHPNCPVSSSGDHTTSGTYGLGIALQDQSEESVASFRTAWLPIHVTTCPVQPLFTSSPMSMVTVPEPGLKVLRDLHHGRI